MKNKSKKIQRIFLVYWCLLGYTIAALIFWFIALNMQNEKMISLQIKDLDISGENYNTGLARLQKEKKKKTAQYAGEGVTFFLVILAGAIFIFRLVRRQLKQSLQQQNFMMAITHELKTPIAVAQLNLETLQKRKLDEGQQQRLIHNTLQETERLNNLCNNMLFSSQIESDGYRMTREEVNFSGIIESSSQHFINRFSNKPINCYIQPDIFINGDAMLLEMAFNNLLDNAIKYSPKSAPVDIRLELKDHIILSITDQGSGINEMDKKKVFEKYYRGGNPATKAAKGTGLGLYLTFRIIKAHGGEIKIADHQPAGTVFSVYLSPA